MKIKLILMLALTVTLFGADTNPVLEPQIELTNASVTLSVSNQTMMVESGGTNQTAQGVLEDPIVVEASKYGALWKLAIALLTVGITFFLGKIDKLPRMALPIATLFLGVGLDMILGWANGLNLSWWDSSMAGGFAVTLREIFNQSFKRWYPLEASKTQTHPIDNAVAINGKLNDQPSGEK